MNLLFGHKKKSRRNASPEVLRYEHLPVPVHLFVERRSNSRISLLKEKIHVRLPSGMPKGLQEQEMERLMKWAQARIIKKDMYSTGVLRKDYMSMPSVSISNDDWALVFRDQPDTMTFKCQVDVTGRSLAFNGPFSETAKVEINDVLKKLLIKVFVKHYREYITKLTSTINDLTFQKSYNTVRLKYMTSRWGSCSSKENINLSVRILLLPEHVRDYIIIHELAHLTEMNHSARFWLLVQQRVPDYRQIEKWLKQNGSKYDL